MKLPKVVFSSWTRWPDRTSIDSIDAPGVYILAQLKGPPIGNADPQVQEIIYIGETCGRTLGKRWENFVRVIDESGEGYLYPADQFASIKLPQVAVRAFAIAGVAG